MFRIPDPERGLQCIKMAAKQAMYSPPVKKSCNYNQNSQTKSACSVPGCHKNGFKSPELSFHSFPSDKEMRNKWIHAIRRDPSKTFQVSVGHFYEGGCKLVMDLVLNFNHHWQ
jgi:hypothetical protein